MNKRSKILKILIVIVVVILVTIIAIISSLFYYVNSKIKLMNQVEINEKELDISENKYLEGFRNIAIFGVDSRADDYGKGNRSDCIIIASINNKTHAIKLMSIYRDTYVQIEGHGLDKIAHAYSYGEAPLAIKTLNTNLDLNITEFVTVNFDSVANAVDALGGVSINVAEEEISEINKYIDETAYVTGKKGKYITETGIQTLDGVQAVTYSRIRKTTGGDYKRSERIRNVIEAMIEKLKTKSISEINSIANQILPQIYTNLSMKDLLSMIPSVTSFNVSESVGWPYNTDGATINSIWYGIPITLESNVVKMHKEIYEDEEYVAPSQIKIISKKIINKSGYSQ